MIVQQAKLPVRVESDPKKFRPLDVPVVEADIGRLQKDTGACDLSAADPAGDAGCMAAGSPCRRLACRKCKTLV